MSFIVSDNNFYIPLMLPIPEDTSVISTAEMPHHTLLTLLKAKTGSAHQAIEQALALTDPGLTLIRYLHRIKQFYSFYKPLESRLLDLSSEISPWLDIRNRQKTALLEADLQSMGQAIENISQPMTMCTALPQLSSPAECLGCLYVLEGATLGGVVISRHIRDTLGVTPETGGLFFHGYGQRTGEMWREFRAAMSAFDAQTHQQEQVILAARATFDTLRRWCTKSSTYERS